ncbi:RecX family transcriptional regulator [Sphingomonas sp. MG17]|uniref:Regulatory protein RecX n=1 Tax=Sphingomonas tagetis TaxID=2949092 RepID=A0A9X2HK57_9SPHN|nr:RecX family transcriptional regulator [Sphingomonas tagetis]MCP3731197.1 RecX family transcriptional regulator [Sphingomonas tagetis]
MPRVRTGDCRPIPPLDAASLDRLALRYVERFATTRGKLAAYLHRKIRERGWDGPPADPTALAERFAKLGYVNDRLFAESKASAMARRGLGARRVNEALRHAGIDGDDAEAIAPQVAARRGETAVAFARRKRIGPFALAPADRAAQAKSVAAMVRAGHSPDLAWKIVRMQPGENVDPFLEGDG